MKFSEAWLREWVNPPVDTKTLTEQLTMAGLEVDSVTPVAGDFSGIVVGHVLSAEQHPNADRLRVCQVDVGGEQPLNIVCGGVNARANLKVAVAIVGAKLPDGFVIKEAKLRGVVSQGMICSADELGLMESSVGILELDQDAPIGMDFRWHLALDDCSIDVDLTPNRGDCLSVLGIAREVAAINAIETPKLPHCQVQPTIEATFPVHVLTPSDCPQYVGRVIEGISMNTPTPTWLKQRLQRSGMRSIHLVVDVTNYVLLELGQPLHAFDRDKLQGAIVVRRGNEDEQLTLLDGRTVAVNSETLLIADEKGPLALAGIMGGLDSAISNTTQNIFIESAFFNPLTLAGRARSFGLSTDASHRFERFVSPDLQILAVERATQLLIDIAGGAPGPLVIVRDEVLLPAPTSILLRKNQIPRLLGIELVDSVIETLLKRLNIQFTSIKDGWQVKVPLYRFDLQREIDLIEEIARIYGYGNIAPIDCPIAANPSVQVDREIHQQIQQFLMTRGYHEAISYSFVDPHIHSLFSRGEGALKLVNPISSELSVMRTSLWPGLVQSVLYNQSRQQSRVRLFEMGLRFRVSEVPDEELAQEIVLAGVVTHSRFPEQWGCQKTSVDFFDVKADLQGLLTSLGQTAEVNFVAGQHVALHPGQTAEILYQNQSIGYVGALHPQLLQSLELEAPVYLFEVLLSRFNKKAPRYVAISKFPAVRRDLALVLDQTIPSVDLLHHIRRVGGEQLKDVWVFDVYQGQGIEPSKKSLAVGLLWQHLERTLLDEEIASAMQRVVAALQTEFNAILRN